MAKQTSSGPQGNLSPSPFPPPPEAINRGEIHFSILSTVFVTGLLSRLFLCGGRGTRGDCHRSLSFSTLPMPSWVPRQKKLPCPRQPVAAWIMTSTWFLATARATDITIMAFYSGTDFSMAHKPVPIDFGGNTGSRCQQDLQWEHKPRTSTWPLAAT